jgi:hypothetical protein
MTSIKKLLYPLVVIHMLFWAGACGYQFSGLQKAPFGVKRFHVAVFENKTLEIGAEVLFSNDLMNELTRDGRLYLTTAREADGLFTGILKLMDIETVARTDSYAATERRVKLTVDVELKDRAGLTLWTGKNITASETYLVVPDKVGTEYNRRTAVSKVSKKIAQRVFQQLNWDF